MNKSVLDFIKSCIQNRRLIWTYHVNMRLEKRFIERSIILSSIDTFEIIEEYPKDKYLPSYLIYAKKESRIIHIQIAVDFENENIIIVTAYQPTTEKWENNFKIRRKP